MKERTIISSIEAEEIMKFSQVIIKGKYQRLPLLKNYVDAKLCITQDENILVLSEKDGTILLKDYFHFIK